MRPWIRPAVERSPPERGAEGVVRVPTLCGEDFLHRRLGEMCSCLRVGVEDRENVRRAAEVVVVGGICPGADIESGRLGPPGTGEVSDIRAHAVGHGPK
jgi:hypothetical protein